MDRPSKGLRPRIYIYDLPSIYNTRMLQYRVVKVWQHLDASPYLMSEGSTLQPRICSMMEARLGLQIALLAKPVVPCR